MSDSDQPKNVRRFGRRDRRDRLPPQPPLFPPDDPDEPAEPQEPEATEEKTEAEEALGPAKVDEPAADPADPPPGTGFVLPPDLDGLELPEGDEDLADIPPDQVRPLRVTPSEERFPPVAPPPPAEEASSPPLPRPRRRGRRLLLNLVTVLALAGSVGLAVYYATIWQDPQSPLNPFAPPTPFIMVTATGPADTAATADAADTDEAAPDTAPAATAESAPVQPFIPDGEIRYIANENGRGCAWASIAGTVTAATGEPISGYRVRISGEGLNETVFSGAARTFGASGYELPLGEAPQAASFTVQLFSPQGAPLSDPVTVETRANCEENVALLDFVENRGL